VAFLTRADKERRVKELLEQGKSTREIADEVHMSFRDIGFIRRKFLEETDAQTKNVGEITLSTDTQAFKLI
jgi:DNA-binding NarL/FixJ family response regulator